jgi:hypothetical protein
MRKPEEKILAGSHMHCDVFASRSKPDLDDKYVFKIGCGHGGSNHPSILYFYRIDMCK